MSAALEFQPGAIIRARVLEWAVLPQCDGEILRLHSVGSGYVKPVWGQSQSREYSGEKAF